MAFRGSKACRGGDYTQLQAMFSRLRNAPPSILEETVCFSANFKKFYGKYFPGRNIIKLS